MMSQTNALEMKTYAVSFTLKGIALLSFITIGTLTNKSAAILTSLGRGWVNVAKEGTPLLGPGD